MLLLPAWAALDGTHRMAHVPPLAAGVAGPPLGDFVAALVQEPPVPAVLPAADFQQVAPPAPTPFPPRVARWRALVEAELTAIRTTRGLSDAITPELVLAVIDAESGGDPNARSSAHAAGLMQVLPTTLAMLLVDVPSPNVFDPTANVRAGILYLDEAMRHHRGSLEWALAAYNAGIPATLRARSGGGVPLTESSAFSTRVLAALAIATSG